MGLTTGKLDPTLNIPQIGSKGDEWMSWHQTLKSNFGRKLANGLWMKAWAKRGNTAANTTELRGYMGKQGVTIDSTAWNKLVDAGGDYLDGIGDFMQMGKYATIGLGVIILGGLGMMVFNLARRPAESIGMAAKAFV